MFIETLCNSVLAVYISISIHSNDCLNASNLKNFLSRSTMVGEIFFQKGLWRTFKYNFVVGLVIIYIKYCQSLQILLSLLLEKVLLLLMKIFVETDNLELSKFQGLFSIQYLGLMGKQKLWRQKASLVRVQQVCFPFVCKLY